MAMPAADPSLSPLVYIDCDIPAGMTIRDWRVSRQADAAVSPMGGVVRRVRRVRRARVRYA
jgi:hypothetical protein